MLDGLQNWAIGLAVLGGVGILAKNLPGLLESKASAALDDLFAKGDANDDALLVAMLTWAEQKYGPGTGAIKAKACVDKMVSMIPLRYRIFVTEKVKAKALLLVQASFDRLEAVVIKAAQEHKPV